MHPYRSKQTGNALFLILIAVALFGALSYALTQSSRGGGGNSSKEQATLLAAQVVSTANTIQQGVMRFSMIGSTASTIETNTPTNKCCAGSGTANNYANFCTTGANCLFAPEGGGLSAPSLPRAAFDTTITSIPAFSITSIFSGPNSHNGIQFDGLHPGFGAPFTPVVDIGTNSADDLLEIYPLKQEVCLAINKGLGISGIPDSAGSDIGGAMAGKESGCIDWFGDDTMFMYYHVLIAH